jgi:hypothetical protein
VNPFRSEQDAFQFLLLVIAVAVATGVAGMLGNGWTAFATLVSVVASLVVGVRLGRRWVESEPPERSTVSSGVPGLPLLVVAPVDLADRSLAREVVAEEGTRSVRVVLFAPEDDLGEAASQRAAELRALLGEFDVTAQVIAVAQADVQKAVAAELRDGRIDHVFVATHRQGHSEFSAEEDLVHAIDRASDTPVVAVAFASS